MSTAAQDIAEGLAALDSELGESYGISGGGGSFVARLERNRPRDLHDLAGSIRETVLHVRAAQAAFDDGLPPAGAIITRPDAAPARLARIDPGDLPGMLIFVLADETS